MISRKIVSTVIAIGSLFYSAISGVVPEFQDVVLDIRGDELVLSARLENCFSEDLDTIFRSGQEIRIYFRVDVLDADSGQPVQETTFYHALTYSLIDGSFDLFRSNTGERQSGLSLEEAKAMLSELEDVGVVVASELSFGVVYMVRVTAHMEKITLPGTNEELNLMFYWSSLKPTVTSGPFTRASFSK
ncbi:MAG: DUF4390 domain-containing protein [Fidelibacterota bacterium]